MDPTLIFQTVYSMTNKNTFTRFHESQTSFLLQCGKQSYKAFIESTKKVAINSPFHKSWCNNRVLIMLGAENFYTLHRAYKDYIKKIPAYTDY